MRLLIAPGSFHERVGVARSSDLWFGPGLSSIQVAGAIASGWAEQAPHDVLTCCPLSDGGSGFIDVILAARGGDLVPVTVTGPFGDPVPATILYLEGDGEAGLTAYLEADQVCGPQFRESAGDADDPDVMRATSAGVGDLIASAVNGGATRVVVGIGDSISHDGGAGLLGALGAGESDSLRRGAGALGTLEPSSLRGLDQLRQRLSRIELIAATATDLPLLGFHGASATDAVRRGASPQQAQQLEAALGHFAHLAQDSLVAGRPLGGSGLAAAAGSGAGGGLGFALLALGAQRVDGVRATLEATRCLDLVPAVDLVVTGVPRFDAEAVRAGVVPQVAAQALNVGIPTVVLAIEVEVGRRELMNLGVSSAYPVLSGPARLADQEFSDPAVALAVRARRVARTWSPSS